jgi:hypothetical protein
MICISTKSNEYNAKREAATDVIKMYGDALLTNTAIAHGTIRNHVKHQPTTTIVYAKHSLRHVN